MHDKHGLDVNVSAAAEANPASGEIRLLLFQSVRELLFNVVKHSGVKSAHVEMSLDDGHVQIVVSDTGAGFDPKMNAEKQRSDSEFGLFSIRERMSLLGGTFVVDSAPGKGTTVTVRVPAQSTVSFAGDQSDSPAPVATQAAVGKVLARPSVTSDEIIRVLVADDQQVLREGLIALLENEPDIEVVAQAADGQQAVELAAGMCPDVVIMDVSMPVKDGVQATRQIVAAMPSTRVIGLSMHDEKAMASLMVKAGASAYLSKDGSSEDLLSTVRSVAAGAKLNN